MTTTTADERWVSIPLEIAKQHSLYGIGGWLILVSIGMLATPVRTLFSLGPIYSGIDYAALHPTMFAFVVGEITVNAIVVLWSIANLFLLFSKNPLFPKSWIGLIGLSAVFVPLDAVLTKFVVDSIGQPMEWSQVFDLDTTREVMRSLVGAAVWIPYAFISRRVNVTFLNRVRNDDPLLREGIAKIF